jgi:hypothetical protein
MTRLEELGFQEASRLDDEFGYRLYLRRFPEGKHAAEAREALERLAYLEAAQTDTLERYQRFLAEHASSSYAKRVKERMEALTGVETTGFRPAKQD